LEENHYYPFGLKHTNYNGQKRKYEKELDLGQQQEMIHYQIKQILAGEYVPYKYKFNGKEYQDELGLNMYSMDMRQYDPAIGRWVVQDPVVHFEYSPYSAFNNSPVFWADPSGADSDVFGRQTSINGKYISVTDRPNIHENSVKSRMTNSQALQFAKLSKHVYGEGGDIGHYKQIEKYEYDSGFKAALYKNGSMYVLAIAGTEKSFKDGKEDVTQLVGIAEQYEQGLKLAVKLLENPIMSGNLTVTGHSLGGGISEYISMNTGIHAVTFNAAGVSIFTSGIKRVSNTDAFILMTDPLNTFQSNSIFPSAGGRKHYLVPDNNLGSYINGHSIDHIIEALTPDKLYQQPNLKL
jgi:RHS repeat-associated protein